MYDSWSNPEAVFEAFGIVFAIYFVVLYLFIALVLIAVAVVSYVFTGLGLKAMLKKLGFDKTWYAFVPFCQSYAAGYIADRYDDGHPKTNYAKKLLRLEITLVALLLSLVPIVSVMVIAMANAEAVGAVAAVTGVLSMLVFFGAYIAMFVVAVIYTVQSAKAYWRIYRIFCPKLSILFLMLSIFASPAGAIILFVLRNREPQNLRIEGGDSEGGFYDTVG